MACTVGHRLQDHLDEVPTGTCGFFIPQPQWSGSYKSRDRGSVLRASTRTEITYIFTRLEHHGWRSTC